MSIAHNWSCTKSNIYANDSEWLFCRIKYNKLGYTGTLTPHRIAHMKRLLDLIFRLSEIGSSFAHTVHQLIERDTKNKKPYFTHTTKTTIWSNLQANWVSGGSCGVFYSFFSFKSVLLILEQLSHWFSRIDCFLCQHNKIRFFFSFQLLQLTFILTDPSVDIRMEKKRKLKHIRYHSQTVAECTPRAHATATIHTRYKSH